MTHRFFLTIIAVFFAALTSAHAEKRVLGKSDEEPLTGKVVVLEVGQKDLVNKASFKFWQRMLARAADEGARAVIIQLDTPGGLAFDTRDLIIDELVKLDVPLYAWVEREALSAGALIAFACDEIYMAEGTTIGSAAIVNGTGQAIEDTMRAKLESAFAATMRGVAEKNGHRYDVIEAMMIVDDEESRTIGPVTVPKGALLNLTASEAVQLLDGEPLLATGIADSIDDVLEATGLTDAELIRPQPTGFEKIAWILAAWSPLLIILGIGGAWLEFKAPGFGIFGLAALIAFALFFFGNFVAGNLAGYELMAMFILGVILVILEIFVFPGLIAGTIGGILIIASLWLAMVDGANFDRIDGDDPLGYSLTEVLIKPGITLAWSMLAALALMLVLMRYLPNIPLFRGFIIEESLTSGTAETTGPTSLVGRTGTAITELRPSGNAEIDGRTVSVIARKGTIDVGTRIRVLEDGMRILVEADEA